jgi:hypothetical protein
MRLFGWLAGGSSSSDKGNEIPPSMPWDDRPSIFRHIREHCRVGQLGLAEEGLTLPDEERITSGSKLRWAPGAMDGVATHHMASGGEDKLSNKAVDLISKYCEQPTARNKAALYESLLTNNIIALIDPVIELLVARQDLNHERLYELSQWLLTEAPDREPVKLGIAFTGLFRNPQDAETFQIIGRHDEFTLFAVVAIRNQGENYELSLWELARNVSGWGRIHVVERLADTARPEIKEWLIREGYRNSVMYEYLVGICARTGDLIGALSHPHCDRKMLTSAGEIISAWIAGGPVEDLSGYEKGVELVEVFLSQMETEAATLDDFWAVSRIRMFVTPQSPSAIPPTESGWTEEKRGAIAVRCEKLMQRSEWISKVEHSLRSDDEIEFSVANSCAQELGINTWDHHWRRLQGEPLNSTRWFHSTVDGDPDHIRAVVRLAEQTLPLSEISCGAADEMGLGRGFEPESCLDAVIQVLGKHVGLGIPLLKAALKSRVVRLRNMAVKVLQDWGQENWLPDMAEAVRAAEMVEPCEDVKRRMTRLLTGQPIDDAM